jgi:hypothetical protein
METPQKAGAARAAAAWKDPHDTRAARTSAGAVDDPKLPDAGKPARTPRHDAAQARV